MFCSKYLEKYISYFDIVEEISFTKCAKPSVYLIAARGKTKHRKTSPVKV